MSQAEPQQDAATPAPTSQQPQKALSLAETIKDFVERCKRDGFNAAISAGPGPQRVVTFVEAMKFFWTRWTGKGRASVSEYNWALCHILLACLAIGLLKALGASLKWEGFVSFFEVIQWLFLLVIIYPLMCLMVRRLHDTGRPGKEILWFFVPVSSRVLKWLREPSELKENAYGPIPNLK